MHASTTQSTFDQLGAVITAAMARLHVPGVAVGIFHAGECYTAGFGQTNINHPLPVDTATLFQIGSTTKTFTATIAMQLVEEGKLAFDEPICTYLPELRLQDAHAQAGVTLRHLFTHTGGWLGDYFDDTGRGADAVAHYVAGMAELPQLTPLGEVWSYNNAGFGLAGRLIEVITGQSYEEVVKQRIFEPLGMTMSFFFAEDVITHRVATGHLVGADETPRIALPWALARSAHPAGGITSNVHDQLRYAQFHLGDGTTASGQRLLTPETMALMQKPHFTAGSMASSVGISWLLQEVGGEQIVGHGGATNGQISAFMMVPTRNFAITILTNANQGRTLNSEITAWAFAHFLGLKNPEPTLRPLPASDLEPFAGHYSAALSDITLTVEDDQLILQAKPAGGFPKKDTPPPPAPPPAPIAFLADDRVVAVDGLMKGNRGEFLRDATGAISWFRWGGRIHKRVVG